MIPEAPAAAEPVPGAAVREAVAARYEESGAARFGIVPGVFESWAAGAVARYGAGWSEREQKELAAGLHVEELVLARACAEGNEDAWRELMARFGAQMHRAAAQMTGDEAAGRELADSLYAELYGRENREGRRVSRLESYMGRGSLGGWLRTVLAQRHLDRCRAQRNDASLEEQMEAGVAFAAPAEAEAAAPDARLNAAVSAALKELGSEARFLLAAYYLDGQKLAAIGRQLGVHESTVSRKLEKVTSGLRKRVRKRLMAEGIERRRSDELLADLDVRDLDVKVRRDLGQEKKMETF
jgi:RNA polymerase sigma-70 factor (ECF subfamily)